MQEIKASPKFKLLCETFEGRRYKSYQDTAGIWTIGIGHTKKVKEGMVITDAKIDELFEEDIADAVQRVKDYLIVEATQNELDALISQAYNLRSYATLAKHFNLDKKVWRTKTLLYCKDVKGNFLKGLKIRRMAERLLSEGREWLGFVRWAQDKKTTMPMILEKEKEFFSL